MNRRTTRRIISLLTVALISTLMLTLSSCHSTNFDREERLWRELLGSWEYTYEDRKGYFYQEASFYDNQTGEIYSEEGDWNGHYTSELLHTRYSLDGDILTVWVGGYIFSENRIDIQGNRLYMYEFNSPNVVIFTRKF